MLTNITIELSKNGRRRSVPMNSTVRGARVDLASRRARPGDPDEVLFPLSHRQTAILRLGRGAGQGALRDAGKDASRLGGYTGHSNRHTFASRLVMAGVDLRTVQELGGWCTLSMVMRYAHVSPAHVHAAVERIAAGQVVVTQERGGSVEVGLKLGSANGAALTPARNAG